MTLNVTGNAADGYCIRTESGATVCLRSSAIYALFQQLRSVGVANLADVQAHYVNRIAGCTSHVVHFVGGGRLRFAFNDQGQLLELSGERLTAFATHDGRMTFGPYRTCAEQS